MAEPRPPETPKAPPPPAAADAGTAPDRPAAPAAPAAPQQPDPLKPQEREIGATALAEASSGGSQDEKVAWAYETFVANEGPKALQRSTAYSQKKELFRVYMVALGDKQFEKDKITEDANFAGKSIKEFVTGAWFRSRRQKRVDRMIKTLQTARDLSKSPIPGVTNQGSAGYESTSDINREERLWTTARQFLWLQRCDELKEPPSGFTLELLPGLGDHDKTVLFNFDAIEGYFKKHPEQLPKKVEKFSAETDRHPPCAKRAPDPSKAKKSKPKP